MLAEAPNLQKSHKLGRKLIKKAETCVHFYAEGQRNSSRYLHQQLGPDSDDSLNLIVTKISSFFFTVSVLDFYFMLI
jgi:hypothetical protein